MTALRANYSTTFSADAWKRIAELATPAVIRDIGRRIAEYAKVLSPYDTGHNRSSIAVVDATGRISNRQSARGGRQFTQATDMIEHGQIAVLTTSGYGGYLEIGANAARYTKKGKRTGKNRQYITSGGKRGSYYMTRASAKVMHEIGMTEAALQTEFAVRAKRAELRAVRKEMGR